MGPVRHAPTATRWEHRAAGVRPASLDAGLLLGEEDRGTRDRPGTLSVEPPTLRQSKVSAEGHEWKHENVGIGVPKAFVGEMNLVEPWDVGSFPEIPAC